MSKSPSFAAACVLLLLVAACSSTPDRASEHDRIEVEELKPSKIEVEEMPIGKVLADLDTTMQRWTHLATTARNDEQRRVAREIEAVLVYRAGLRFDDLLEELESGPPHNRIRAASVLGFSQREEALPPLLAALSDPYGEVVHNALLGLALLESPNTPLAPICELLTDSPDAHTRSNAAYALRTVIAAGGSGPSALMAARSSLHDPEPLVRVQVALVLGLLSDDTMIRPLSDQMYDEMPLVANAAVEALFLIADQDPGQRGPVARELIPAMTKVQPALRSTVRRALYKISGVDYGRETEDWLEWANGLP